MKGIDVSHWQGAIDWHALRAAGYEFVIIRASHGTAIDDRFAMHYDGATAAGFVVGGYHYMERGGDWQAQADTFLEAIEGRPLAFVALDLEDQALDPETTAVDALGWLRAVEHPSAYVYTGLEPAGRLHFAHVPELGEWPLWVATYGRSKPYVPAPWTTWALWQHAGDGTAPGVRGHVDLDVAVEGWEP